MRFGPVRAVPFLAWLALWPVTAAPLGAQPQQVLHGRLFWVDDRARSAAADVEVTTPGAAAQTDADGAFRLPLLPVHRPGETVTVGVLRAGWFVGDPPDGEVRIPYPSEPGVVEIELYRVGSERFWSDERIERFLIDTAEAALERLDSTLTRPGIVLDFYVRRWAGRHGWGFAKARGRVGDWIGRAEQSGDPFRGGLAALARGDLEAAAARLRAAAETARGKLDRREDLTETEADALARRAARSYGLESNVHFLANDFNAAADTYKLALDQLSWQDSPQLWAATTWSAATVHLETALQLRKDREHRTRHLLAARKSFESALQVFNRRDFPLRWAAAQHGLAQVVGHLGNDMPAAEGSRLLAQSAQMLASVLEVRRREDDPHLWASTRFQMALPAINLGARAPGEEGRALLDQAVGIFSEVSEVRTLAATPDLWILTQYNLATTLGLLGDRTPGLEGARLFEAAAQLCVTALERGEDHLDDYGRQLLYQELAGANARRAERGGDARSWLAAAAEARRQALLNADRELDPADWAARACELGAALLKLAKSTADEQERGKILEEARAVLEQGTLEAAADAPDGAEPLAHLAEVRWLQGDAGEAVLILRETLREHRSYREGHLMLRSWARDHLYDFELAYRTLAGWLEAHPGDLGGHVALTQDLWTTGRFEACANNAATLREDPRVAPEDRAFLLVQEIAARRILNHPSREIAALVRSLAASVARLPPGLTAAWQTRGTTYFLEHAEKVAPHRTWLLELFAVLDLDDRDRVVAELEKLAASVDLPRA